MTTNEQKYDEQLNVLRQRFPQAPENKINRLLQRHNGDIDKVGARLVQRQFQSDKWDSFETRFGSAVTALQQEYAINQPHKRIHLLKLMVRFDGDVDKVRKFLQKVAERRLHKKENPDISRRQLREELKTKYATQLAELATAGINVNSPSTLRQLEKNQGDVNKVIEIKSRRKAKKEKLNELNAKYASQITQLEADNIGIKNKKVLARLLEKANGQIDVAKQLANERKEKRQQKKEKKHKHRGKSPVTTIHTGDEKTSTHKKRHELSTDDLDNLKQLRSAGVRGKPRKVLSIFHECNNSIELTIARIQGRRERRLRNREERLLKRTLLGEAQNAYLALKNLDDWPHDIEQVYLDGNNMMFVVKSLRRLCLNQAGQKTEHAIGEIASAWNEKMHIPNVELIFDSTQQLDQIGTVKVTSAQPKYKTTDDMLVEIARQNENHEKNKRTIVVTSDRALAVLLHHEGCLVVKPYNWFAHCATILIPDLIKYEEITGTMSTASTPTTVKIHYNLDELVHRIAKIDI